MGETVPLTGPDLAKGVAIADVPERGALLGHANGESVLLVRPGGGTAVFAVGATCTHYGAWWCTAPMATSQPSLRSDATKRVWRRRN